MASLEQRGHRFRVAFRLGGAKHHVNVKAADRKEAESCLARIEENLRLVERGRLMIPDGADVGLFLLSDGKLDRKVAVLRAVRLSELFKAYRENFTVGAKEPITRKMEDIHMKHLVRIIGDKLVSEITSGVVQQFVDARGREKHNSDTVKTTTVRKATATLRFVVNWGFKRGITATKFPDVELQFAKERQPEPFRTYDQIDAILARGPIDAKRNRELWDGLFLDPVQVSEVLEVVRKNARSTWLFPFLVTAAYTGARRSELFRSRVEDFDFQGKLVHLRELKRNRAKETFRTVDMTPVVESAMRGYFQSVHPGGTYAFSSMANLPITDKPAWRAFRAAVARTRWKVLRGYHAFRHSFASNLAAGGVDQRVIDELMGHSTLEMQQRYRHLFPQQRRAALMAVFG